MIALVPVPVVVGYSLFVAYLLVIVGYCWLLLVIRCLLLIVVPVIVGYCWLYCDYLLLVACRVILPCKGSTASEREGRATTKQRLRTGAPKRVPKS